MLGNLLYQFNERPWSPIVFRRLEINIKGTAAVDNHRVRNNLAVEGIGSAASIDRKWGMWCQERTRHANSCSAIDDYRTCIAPGHVKQQARVRISSRRSVQIEIRTTIH